jgi:hypothetical protein
MPPQPERPAVRRPRRWVTSDFTFGAARSNNQIRHSLTDLGGYLIEIEIHFFHDRAVTSVVVFGGGYRFLQSRDE